MIFLNVIILRFNFFICINDKLYLNKSNMNDQMRNYSYNNKNGNMSDYSCMNSNTYDAHPFYPQHKQLWPT